MDEMEKQNETECEENETEVTQTEDTQDGPSTAPECEEAVPDADEGIEKEESDARTRVEELRAEIAALEGELERKRAETDKAAREYADFKELYPDVDIDTLPSEVTESVEAGIPLAAAYALYEKRLEKHNSDVAAHNKSTRADSFGSVGKSAESDYFTPTEVRAMTQSEVRANYAKILKSMKSWS